MKCVRFRCNNEAEYTADGYPFCAHDAVGCIGLKAGINTAKDPARNSDECDYCGAPLLGDFYARDVKGRLFCSVECAFSRNGVQKLI